MDLKEFRKKYKLTQQKFADMLGISRSTYRDIEMGKAAPSQSLLDNLPKVQEQLEDSTTAAYIEEVTVTKYNKERKVLKRETLRIDLGDKEQQLYDALFGNEENKEKRKKEFMKFVERRLI